MRPKSGKHVVCSFSYDGEDLNPDITEFATIARENEKLETLIGFLDEKRRNGLCQSSRQIKYLNNSLAECKNIA